jgi:hypothetical protein
MAIPSAISKPPSRRKNRNAVGCDQRRVISSTSKPAISKIPVMCLSRPHSNEICKYSSQTFSLGRRTVSRMAKQVYYPGRGEKDLSDLAKVI